MNKLLIILIAGLILFGCGGQKKEEKPQQKDQFAIDSSGLKTVPVENPNQQYYLRFKLAKGTTYNFRLTAISKDDQTISSKDTTLNQTINQTMIYNVGLNVTDIDADSTMEIKAEISSIKVDGNAGEQQLHYQSGVTKDTAEIDKFAQYESLVKNPFSVRVSKYGELLDIFRADGIVNKLLKIRGYSDSLKTEEKASLKNDITEGVLKPLLSQIFRKLPENKVAKDSSWNLVQPPSQMMVFQVQNTSVFKITGTKKLGDEIIADIDAGLKTKISGNNKVSQQGVNYEFQNPKTSGGGIIYFNVSRGLIQKTKISTSIVIAFNMESKGEKGNKKEVITTTNLLEYLP